MVWTLSESDCRLATSVNNPEASLRPLQSEESLETMSIHRKLTTVCCAAVLALGLAACGSSDNDRTPAGGGGADGGGADGGGAGGGGGDTKTVSQLFQAALDTAADAMKAGMEAEQAVKDATKYSVMINALSVDGDSAMAVKYAQKVLDAQITADDAVTKAEMVLSDAEACFVEAMKLDDGAIKNSLVEQLEDAIETATAQVEAAKAEAEGTALKTAVELVTGTDEDDLMSAADHGVTVAMDVGGALMPGTDGARGTRAPHGTTAAPPGDKTAVRMKDTTGMTFVQIVGEDKVMMSRFGVGNTNVPIASIAGMTATEVHSELTLEAYDDGANLPDSTYKGISGTAHCLGTDCTISAGKLAGSWYFEPDEPTHVYLKDATATTTMYDRDQMFAQFGYWLTPSEAGIVVNTYALSGTTEAGAWTLNEAPATTLLDKTATYSGTAAACPSIRPSMRIT